MKTLLKLLVIIVVLTSCTKEQESIFSENPTTRIQEKIKKTKDILVNANNGWLLMYFPNLRQNQYQNIKENLYKDDLSYIRLKRQVGFGYGGYSFLVKFNNDNSFNMQSDVDLNQPIINGEFNFMHKNDVQLSFLTRNPIHHLTSKGFNGKATFIVKEILDDKIVLATDTNIYNKKEYIVLTKNSPSLNWKNYFNSIYDIKNEFENMKHPVLEIKNKDKKTVFISDYYPRKFVFYGLGEPLFIHKKKRFSLFVQNLAPNTHNSKFFVGIASGYLFTDEGIFFNNGFIFNEEIVFKKFKRVAKKEFVANVNGFTAKIKEK